MKQIFTFIAALCIGISCSDNSVSPGINTTESSDRTPEPLEFNVVITLSNESSYDTYFFQKSDRLGFWTLKRKIGNSWVDVDRKSISYSTVYPNGRTKLSPGEVLRDSFLLTQAGTYQIGFPFAWDENESEIDSLTPKEFIAE